MEKRNIKLIILIAIAFLLFCGVSFIIGFYISDLSKSEGVTVSSNNYEEKEDWGDNTDILIGNDNDSQEIEESEGVNQNIEVNNEVNNENNTENNDSSNDNDVVIPQTWRTYQTTFYTYSDFTQDPSTKRSVKWSFSTDLNLPNNGTYLPAGSVGGIYYSSGDYKIAIFTLYEDYPRHFDLEVVNLGSNNRIGKDIFRIKNSGPSPLHYSYMTETKVSGTCMSPDGELSSPCGMSGMYFGEMVNGCYFRVECTNFNGTDSVKCDEIVRSMQVSCEI